MTDRIKELSAEALSGKPFIKCEFGDGINDYVFDPCVSRTVNYARCVCHCLKNSIASICDNSRLAGNTGIRYTIPEVNGGHGEPFEKYGNVYNKLWICAGNHTSANFEFVITHGIEGYLEKIAAVKPIYKDNREKTEFLNSLESICFAIGDCALNYTNAAAVLAETASGERRADIIQLSRICARVPMKPAGSFHEAVQAFWFIFMLFPDGLGRIDKYLYPYYIKDISEGRITRDYALELIEELFLRIFSIVGKDSPFSSQHHMVIGGYNEEGEDIYNELTDIVLEAICDLPTWRPQVTFRRTAKTTRDQLEKIVRANIKRSDLVMFTNDDVLLRGLCEVMNVPYYDAVNYSLSGCSELILTGQSQMGSVEGFLNVMYAMERLMEDRKSFSEINDFDQFYAAYAAQLEKDVRSIVDISRMLDIARYTDIDLMSSLFNDGCIESAARFSRGGAKYNFCNWIAVAIVNAADALSVIRQFVFEEKRYTLGNMADMLDADWNGYEKERGYIFRNGRFFGNDIEEADALVSRIAQSLNSFVQDRIPARGGRYTFGTLTGLETAHVAMGSHSKASPDGRHTGDVFTASITPEAGKDKNGVTAFLKSAAGIDYNSLQNSVVVNIKLDRLLAANDTGIAALTEAVYTYLNIGGVQLQINYVSAEELLEAQKNPGDYASLRVRITGFSAFFTTLDKKLQDEVISRTLHSK